MAIAWSQIDVDSKVLAREVLASFIHSKWIYALPMPAFFALSGTLVYRWFSAFDETAAIAANFAVSSLVLIPLAAFTSGFGQALHSTQPHTVAVLLLLLGTLAGSAAGRVFYQMALTATEDDNGYVTMFFLLIPALLSDLFHAVVVDSGSAIRSQRNVFRRLGARDDLAPHLVVSVLAEERTRRFAVRRHTQRR